MFNRNIAHDVTFSQKKKITKRSEPTNQAQSKINIVKGLQTYLNDLFTNYKGFKIRLVIIEILRQH